MLRDSRRVVPALALILVGALSFACGRDAAVSTGDVVYRVPVTGVVELGLAPYIGRSLQEAEAEGALAVVLDINTPGGRIDAAEQIVDAITDAEVPVYALVNTHAYSAGAMIAIATDGVYMRPGAVMGAATPVDGAGEKASEKIVSAMRSQMRALAERRGLDPRIAEAMVDEEIAIEGLDDERRLLTLTTSEAVRVGYAQEVEDWDQLVATLEAEDARVVITDENWAESLVRFFTHPVVASLLLSIGMIGLLVEIKTPTFGLAGAAGIASLALFFGSHYIIGLAGWEEAILIGAGLVLLGIELFVVPGFGAFGIGGILALLAGLYLSLISHLPLRADINEAAYVLSASLIAVLVATWALFRYLPGSSRLARSGIMLSDVMDRDRGYVSAAARKELEGATGVALTDLRPAGAAEFAGERVDVVAEANWISAGTPVRIVRSEGYRHVVRAAS